MTTKSVYLLCAAIVLIADQWSKLWATASIKPIGDKDLIEGFLRWNYATNRGVAFSLCADCPPMSRWILCAVSLVAALIVLGYFRRSPAGKKWLNVSLSLLLAGIVGNMIDRVRLGEVVDFIEFHWSGLQLPANWWQGWPIFNIADSAICVGAIMLAWEMLREEKAARKLSSDGAEVAAASPEQTSVSSSES